VSSPITATTRGRRPDRQHDHGDPERGRPDADHAGRVLAEPQQQRPLAVCLIAQAVADVLQDDPGEEQHAQPGDEGEVGGVPRAVRDHDPEQVRKRDVGDGEGDGGERPPA